MELGYHAARDCGLAGICGIRQMVYTGAIVVRITHGGYTGRYCYATIDEARQALAGWDGRGVPPGDSIKYKGADGERLGLGCTIKLRFSRNPMDFNEIDRQQREFEARARTAQASAAEAFARLLQLAERSDTGLAGRVAHFLGAALGRWEVWRAWGVKRRALGNSMRTPADFQAHADELLAEQLAHRTARGYVPVDLPHLKDSK